MKRSGKALRMAQRLAVVAVWAGLLGYVIPAAFSAAPTVSATTAASAASRRDAGPLDSGTGSPERKALGTAPSKQRHLDPATVRVMQVALRPRLVTVALGHQCPVTRPGLRQHHAVPSGAPRHLDRAGQGCRRARNHPGGTGRGQSYHPGRSQRPQPPGDHRCGRSSRGQAGGCQRDPGAIHQCRAEASRVAGSVGGAGRDRAAAGPGRRGQAPPAALGSPRCRAHPVTRRRLHKPGISRCRSAAAAPLCWHRHDRASWWRGGLRQDHSRCTARRHCCTGPSRTPTRFIRRRASPRCDPESRSPTLTESHGWTRSPRGWMSASPRANRRSPGARR